MTFLQIVIFAAISFLVTMWLSWRGDDDILRRAEGRGSTRQEANARSRFVISKTLTTVSCGCAIAVLINNVFVNNVFGLSLSENGKLFIIMVCMGFFFFVISECQNAIRRTQNREARPAIDLTALRDKFGMGRRKD